MLLRKANEKDSEQISKVLTSFYNMNEEESKSTFENEIKKGHHYIVAEDEEKIIGLVTWLMHGLPKHQLAELDRIAVLSEYQGKGVAKELFNALLKEAKEFFKKHNSKLRKLYLLTHADNTRAHRFYEKMTKYMI